MDKRERNSLRRAVLEPMKSNQGEAMRKSLLLAMLVALSATGVAFAASTVVNYYVVKAKIKPVKSGTTSNPVPIGTEVSYTVNPPANTRPKIVKTLAITVQGTRENTNKFPACGTARLIDPKQGPTTCPKGSLIGSGYLTAALGPSAATTISSTCRADVSIYNGGNHKLSYYLYKGPETNACAVPNGHDVWNATLTQTPKGMVQTFTIPSEVRHPATGVDSAATFTTLATPAKFKTVKKSKTVKKHKVGLFESILCPANHQRQLAVKFTREDGTSKTATRLLRCT
jgi:hypothetical protein